MNEARRSSFYWAMRLMPRAQRRAMFAVYGWCRTVDDIADADLPAEIRRAGLAAARRHLDQVFAADDGTEMARAIRRHRLDGAWFEMVLDGLDTDVTAPLHAPDLPTLDLYCRRVAGAVGRIAVAIFGCNDDAAADFAFSGGTALQFTNILRDVQEDAARGRLYLPREALAAAAMRSDDLGAILADPRLADAKAWLAARAQALYDQAESSAARSDRRRLWPGLAMLRLYRRLLDRLPAEERPKLGTLEAIAIVLACRFGLAR
ncbi:MAG: squalene synthase HpnD [Alphaproteobacteria bacterium]|nr:squalene synthase HpnD [Alphaproteobacteria bacterium]